jgi:signal transduction histidine kinase
LLAIREFRSQVAVVRCIEGVRSAGGLGLAIEPGVGVGGAVLVKATPWCGEIRGDTAVRPSDQESTILGREGVRYLMAMPLLTTGFWGETRVEGLAYVGTRRGVAWSDKALAACQRLGRQLARTVRDAQRVSDMIRRWEDVWAQLAASGNAAEHRLDRVAHQIAVDARAVLRSGIGIVFRRDAASGALHSLGVDGKVTQVVRAMGRGQVLPPGCGSAGRAAALGRAFITRNYSGEVDLPPIMAEAVATLPTMTTLSVPLRVGHGIIGAVTVGRWRTTPLMDYSDEDIRVAQRLAKAAGPLLARAQLATEHARRQQGASELSRLAGSLTQRLTVSAVCQQLGRSVLALVHGTCASVWSASGQSMIPEMRPSGVLREPKDPRLRRILDLVTDTRQAFWTPDLTNDPRLVVPRGSKSIERDDARAVLVAPIRIRETLLGFLGVTGVTGRTFTDADVELVQALADQAALGIANARAYDELQASNVQLLRHEKLVAMGRLTSGLAHELRNPLQNVVALTSELLERARGSLPTHPESVDSAEYLRRAYGEAKRAADIVDRLLDYVRERARTFDTIDLRNVVADAVVIASPTAGSRGMQITTMSDDTPILVRADPIMLRQVVLNLLNNALDAVDGQGTVEIRTRLDCTAIESPRAIVSVRDTGRGIPAEHLPDVFEPFFTTKEVGHGVGLGLALCQSLIEQHGGTIQVESPGIGRGTTVQFELPAKP